MGLPEKSQPLIQNEFQIPIFFNFKHIGKGQNFTVELKSKNTKTLGMG